MNINTHLIIFITGTYVDVTEVSKFFRSTESSCGGHMVWFLYHICKTTAEISGIKDRRKKHTYTLFNLWAPVIGLRKDYCEKLL
jgi:hypothetical protein